MAEITKDNSALAELKPSWQTAEYSAEDGIGAMGSLHEAGDSIVAVGCMEGDKFAILGSGVMVAPGLMLTATHVLDEFASDGNGPVFLTFLPNGARAWLPHDWMTVSGPSKFDDQRKVVSDLSLVSCTLNSKAYLEHPLMLAPIEISLPLVGDRLWAIGFRHQGNKENAALITPFVSSGLVMAAFPHGRGERMASPCFEVDMDTVGGMSGGPVFNSKGFLVGIVSSSLEGGPSHITLVWEAMRYRVKGTVPKLMINETVSLLGAKEMGLVKLAGHISRDPFGDVTFKLSREEMNLFRKSISDAEVAAARPNLLNENQVENFLDAWGHEFESSIAEAAILSVQKVSLTKAREFLEHSDIPIEYWDAIIDFSIEDFDGLEDVTITRTEEIDELHFRLFYDFEFHLLIWTVKMEKNFVHSNILGIEDHFFNLRMEDDNACMELYQRRFFRGSIIFNK